MDSVMRFGFGFLSLCVVSAVAIAAPALGNSLPGFPQKDDGTYRTIPNVSNDVCEASCKSDSDICRGWAVQTVTTTPDTRYPDISYDETLCMLNNGKGAEPMFPSQPPEPLDIFTAVNDLNVYRAENNLSPVTLNHKLSDASKVHALDLSKFDFISHTGTDGSSHSDRVQRQGYYFTIAGENVATGQKSWDKVFKAWQKSPGHNENLLLPEATEFGIALVYDPDTKYQTFWAMVMANPMDMDAGVIYR